jgi:23S rRNA pseudouridine1911/1915/1917 synthase
MSKSPSQLRAYTVIPLKTRLDKALVLAFPEISRSRIQKDIEAGLVRVEGKVVKEPKYIVRKDDALTYAYVPYAPPIPKDMPIKTLYNKEGLLIIDKPPGLVVHPGAGFKGDSLVQMLLYRFQDIHIVGESDRPGIVHRLDKDTSGAMLIATTQEMYAYLKDAFANQRVHKTYTALVAGLVEEGAGTIDTTIGKSRKDFRRMTVVKTDQLQPKTAKTSFEVIRRYPASATTVKEFMKAQARGEFIDGYTLLRVYLHTGRTHQIRVHMASIGHPIVGDTLYGKKTQDFPILKRQFLHASKIEVQLPDGTWIHAESELPEDLQTVLNNF